MSNLSSILSPRISSKISVATLPAVQVVFRIGVGLLFMQHGVQKLFGLLGGVDGAGTSVPLFSLFGVAGVLETFGGLAIVLGLLTRPVAVLLSGQMVIAYFLMHAPQGGFPIQNGGELALFYALAFGLLFATGAGKWSIDQYLLREESSGRSEQSRRTTIEEHRRAITDREPLSPERKQKVSDERNPAVRQ